jgi:DNA processing protein
VDEFDIASMTCSLLQQQSFFTSDSARSHHPGELIDHAMKREGYRVMKHVDQVYHLSPGETAKRIIDRCHVHNIHWTSLWHRDYPKLLKHIADPPAVIYWKGKGISGERSISVVGSRNAYEKSLETTRRIVREVVESNCTVVSGLAKGIDGEAHKAALENHGSTIAVLGVGLHRIYPKGNSKLAEHILAQDGSLLMSELPPGIEPWPWTFVKRNRIISGLSKASVVVQAGEKSGALITARDAASQGREVYCCTGYSYDARYLGALQLIDEGAHPFISTERMLQESGLGSLPVLHREKKEPQLEHISDDSSTEGAIISLCRNGPIHPDRIIRQSRLDPATVMTTLTLLEISGRITRVNGKIYLNE